MKKPPKMKKIPSVVKESKSKSKSIEPYSENPQPNLYLTEKVLPEIKNWEIGKEYDLMIKVKMTGIREQDYGMDKGKVTADFKITQIGVPK